MGKLVLLVVGAALAALPASSSAGAPVTVEFSGTVTLVQDQIPISILDGSVQVGTPFSGSFTYDTVGTDSTADPAIGTYIFAAPPAAFRIEVGNYVFEMPTDQPYLGVGVQNGSPDGFFVTGFPPITISGPLDPFYAGVLPQVTSMGFGLVAPAPGPLSSDGLPTSPLLVSDWPTRTIRIQAGADVAFAIEGTVAAIVPEPSAASLLVVSLAGLASLARWRARPR